MADPGDVEGVLEITERGFGFLRDSKRNYRPMAGDVFVSPPLIHGAGLLDGLLIRGSVRPDVAGGESDRRGSGGREPSRGPQLTQIAEINGVAASAYLPERPFADLVSIDPGERLSLARSGADISMRIVDLITPIGKGQRGLIVAAPKTGKTTLIEEMAAGLAANHPEITLLVLLIDERPEEVTHLRRSVRGEVLASSSDESTESQLRLSRLVLERGKRLVEQGRDAVILLDSITRFGRASNRGQTGRGKTMSGGIDSRALEFPRKFFGAARNVEGGGSLTILATALVNTGSQMDEVIFQEFKGTGNMELVLDRRLSERRIFPSIDINASGTRKEEKLFTPWELPRVTNLRRALSSLKSAEAMEVLLKAVRESGSNEELLQKIPE